MPEDLLDKLQLRAVNPEDMDLSAWEITNPEILSASADDLARLLPGPGLPLPPVADGFLSPDQVAEIKIRELLQKVQKRTASDRALPSAPESSISQNVVRRNAAATAHPIGYKNIDGAWSAWMWYIHGHGMQAYLDPEVLQKFIEPWYSYFKHSAFLVDGYTSIEKEIQSRVRKSKVGEHLHFRLSYTIYVHNWFPILFSDHFWLFLGTQVRFYVDVDCDVVRSSHGKPISKAVGDPIPGGANLRLTIDKTYTFDDWWNSPFRWFVLDTGTDYHITNSWDDFISVGE